MKYTYAELAQECRVEADMRRSVYRRQRAGKGLTPSQTRRIDMMDTLAVMLDELSGKHDPEPAIQTDLIGEQ